MDPFHEGLIERLPHLGVPLDVYLRLRLLTRLLLFRPRPVLVQAVPSDPYDSDD